VSRDRHGYFFQNSESKVRNGNAKIQRIPALTGVGSPRRLFFSCVSCFSWFKIFSGTGLRVQPALCPPAQIRLYLWAHWGRRGSSKLSFFEQLDRRSRDIQTRPTNGSFDNRKSKSPTGTNGMSSNRRKSVHEVPLRFGFSSENCCKTRIMDGMLAPHPFLGIFGNLLATIPHEF
jgi:hypothetical protein